MLLVLMLLQARPIESSIDAFIKGDKGARADLITAGPYAIRPLQKAREKSPKKIDELVFELKKAAAYPVPQDFEGKFKHDGVLTSSSEDKREVTVSDLGLYAVIPFFVDRFDPAQLKSPTYVLKDIPIRSSLEAAREVCRQTGLDFGFFHHHIVLALPDRLWPSGPPPPRAELVPADQARAKALIEQLGDKVAEKRDAARRDLIKFGPGIISILELQLKRKEAGIASACTALLALVRPRAGAFGPAAALRQELDYPTIAVLRGSVKKTPDFRWHQNLPLNRLAEIWERMYSVKLDVRKGADKGITIGLTGSLLDCLSLMTQTWDLDLAVVGDEIVIDEREAIEKLVSTGN